MRGGILFLDLATQMGWAEQSPSGQISHGSVRLGPPGAAQGERQVGLFKWLWDRLGAFRPDLLAVEAPLAPNIVRGRTNADTAQMLFGMVGVVEAVAGLRGVLRVSKVNVQDVRGHFIGGRGFLVGGKPVVGKRNLERRMAKICTAERCRELGWSPADDNAADALAGLSYVLALRSPARGTATTPLFEGRAA